MHFHLLFIGFVNHMFQECFISLMLMCCTWNFRWCNLFEFCSVIITVLFWKYIGFPSWKLSLFTFPPSTASWRNRLLLPGTRDDPSTCPSPISSAGFFFLTDGTLGCHVVSHAPMGSANTRATPSCDRLGMLVGWNFFSLGGENTQMRSMGLVYLPTWMVHFYGKCIGKYTIQYHTLCVRDIIQWHTLRIRCVFFVEKKLLPNQDGIEGYQSCIIVGVCILRNEHYCTFVLHMRFSSLRVLFWLVTILASSWWDVELCFCYCCARDVRVGLIIPFKCFRTLSETAPFKDP